MPKTQNQQYFGEKVAIYMYSLYLYLILKFLYMVTSVVPEDLPTYASSHLQLKIIVLIQY